MVVAPDDAAPGSCCLLLDLPPLAQSELRRTAALVLGVQGLNPSALKLRITSRTRSWLVNATFAIAVTSMPCADSSTICTRRQVTTEAAVRRTIRTSRRPTSSSISRTRTRSATRPSLEDQHPSSQCPDHRKHPDAEVGGGCYQQQASAGSAREGPAQGDEAQARSASDETQSLQLVMPSIATNTYPSFWVTFTR